MKPLKSGITKKNDPDVVLLISSMAAGAPAHPELDNPPVTLVDLGTSGTDLSTAMTEEQQAKEAWLAKRSARRTASKDARQAARLYAAHAHTRFAGDKAKLQTLGLDVVEITGLLGTLAAPVNLRSRPGKLNQTIKLIWKAVRGRESHELQCAESAAGPWNEVYRGRKSRAICLNLVSGKEYFFRVRAHGAAGPGAWSDITSTRAT